MIKLTAVLFLAAAMAGASVLEVGPINLTGSGTFFGPDPSPYGAEGTGGQAIGLDASGTNGTDWVSIHSRTIVPVAFMAVTLLPNPIFVPMIGCIYLTYTSYLLAFPLCEVTINGMTGYSNFTQIGGPGKLQLYSDPLETQMIAEAQINTHVVLTSFAYRDPTRPDPLLGFQSTFDLVANPEPATWITGLAGFLVLASRRKLASIQAKATR